MNLYKKLIISSYFNMFENRLALRHHGRVLLIASYNEFGICFHRPEFRNSFERGTVEIEWRINRFLRGNPDNIRQLQQFWERQASFCFTRNRMAYKPP